MPNFLSLLFMLYLTAAFEFYKFEREIQIQGSLAASLQEKLLGECFQKAYLVYLIRCLWFRLLTENHQPGFTDQIYS